MIKNPVRTSFNRMRGAHGLINEISDNPMRWTVEEIWCVYRHQFIQENQELKNLYIEALRHLEHKDYPGLLIRRPGEIGRQQGPDDYVAWGLASYLLGAPYLARGTLDHIRENGGVLNQIKPNEPTIKSILTRQVQLVAHLKLGAKFFPFWYETLMWAIAIIHSAHGKADDQDNWMLGGMLVEVAWRRSNFLALFAYYWQYKMRGKIKNGLGGMLAKLDSNGRAFYPPDHPVVKWLWDYYPGPYKFVEEKRLNNEAINR